MPDEPEVVRIANIQHLGDADPRAARARRSRRSSSPACCTRRRPSAGSPSAVALPLIRALEGIDRGWYAGPLGWTDANEDGEFCVALRCALLEGALARCYAGVGVVADSEPAAELAETEVKLGALAAGPQLSVRRLRAGGGAARGRPPGRCGRGSAWRAGGLASSGAQLARASCGLRVVAARRARRRAAKSSPGGVATWCS